MKKYVVNQTHLLQNIKFANYNKLNEEGVIPENTLLENRDIIIAKVQPIKENKNDHTKSLNMRI